MMRRHKGKVQKISHKSGCGANVQNGYVTPHSHKYRPPHFTERSSACPLGGGRTEHEACMIINETSGFIPLDSEKKKVRSTDETNESNSEEVPQSPVKYASKSTSAIGIKSSGLFLATHNEGTVGVTPCH